MEESKTVFKRAVSVLTTQKSDKIMFFKYSSTIDSILASMGSSGMNCLH